MSYWQNPDRYIVRETCECSNPDEEEWICPFKASQDCRSVFPQQQSCCIHKTLHTCTQIREQLVLCFLLPPGHGQLRKFGTFTTLLWTSFMSSFRKDNFSLVYLMSLCRHGPVLQRHLVATAHQSSIICNKTASCNNVASMRGIIKNLGGGVSLLQNSYRNVCQLQRAQCTHWWRLLALWWRFYQQEQIL